MKLINRFCAAMTIIVFGGGGGSLAHAAIGELDISFANNGIQEFNVGNGRDFGGGAYTDAMGRTYVVIFRQDVSGSPSTVTASTNIARLTSAGVLDTTFGNNGLLAPAGFSPHPSNFFEFTQIVVDEASSRIFLIGSGTSGLVIAKFTFTGAADTAYGSNGVASLTTPGDIPGCCNYHDAKLLPDGKLVVAADRMVFATAEFDTVVARINANGSADTSFGGDGFVLHNLAAGQDDLAFGISPDGDGKLLLAGMVCPTDSFTITGCEALLTRLTSTGGLDPSFGSNGQVKVLSGFTVPGSSLVAVIPQASGKIAVLGYAGSGDVVNKIFIARLSSAGVLDSSFGDSGVQSECFTDVAFYYENLHVTPTGSLMLAGHDAFDDGDSSSDDTPVFVARLLGDAELTAAGGGSGIAAGDPATCGIARTASASASDSGGSFTLLMLAILLGAGGLRSGLSRRS